MISGGSVAHSPPTSEIRGLNNGLNSVGTTCSDLPLVDSLQCTDP